MDAGSMRVAVIGTGMVGQAIAGRLAELGHEVTVGTRDVAVARERTFAAGAGEGAFGDWAAAHPEVDLAELATAATGAQVVVNATPGQVSLSALAEVGEGSLAGTILLDVSNPLDFTQGFPPTLFVKDTDSLGEQIQAAFPECRVVKSLNTLTAELMVRPAQLAGGRHSTFVSGDDAEAKSVVVALLTSMGHTDVIDLGGIDTSRGVEMYLALWLRTMGALGTGMFNIRVMRDT